jgi:two-component system, chemotaxis family, chemotaxis protein CheY
MTVLVVDDSMFMRNIISEILEKNSIEVVGQATNGREAVDKYNLLRPDIVTMDLTMPDMKGIDAIRLIIEQDPNARIIVCSSMGQREFIREAIDAGAKGFVIKPFEEEDIVKEVTKVIHVH